MKELLINNKNLILQWNWNKNLNLNPNILTSNSHKKAYFICSNQHESFIEIRKRKKRNCLECFKLRNIIIINNTKYKICSVCNLQQEALNFKKHSSRCIPCFKKEQALKGKIRYWTPEFQNKFRSPEQKIARKERTRNYDLKTQYNLSIDDYTKMLEKQNFKCYGCKITVSELGKNLVIDHNHKTGKIRGLLCQHCNLLLGNAKDNIEILQNLIEYLKKNQ